MSVIFGISVMKAHPATNSLQDAEGNAGQQGPLLQICKTSLGGILTVASVNMDSSILPASMNPAAHGCQVR